MADVIGAWTLRSASVIIVVKSGLLVSGNKFNQIIGRLVSDVRILFQENGILADFISDFVFRVFGVLDTEGHIGVQSAGWRSFGIAIAMVGHWRMVWQGGVVGGVMKWGMMGVCGVGHSEGDKNGSKLK